MKMNSWLATLTKRWHTNALLSTTHDDVGGHSARVVLLLLRLKPDASRDAIIRAVTHDLGEKSTADLAYPFKKAEPEIASKVKEYEESAIIEMGFAKADLSSEEVCLIRLADWLDSFLWALSHQPEMVMYSKAWEDQLKDASLQAFNLGVHTIFNDILEEVISETAPHFSVHRKERPAA